MVRYRARSPSEQPSQGNWQQEPGQYGCEVQEQGQELSPENVQVYNPPQEGQCRRRRRHSSRRKRVYRIHKRRRRCSRRRRRRACRHRHRRGGRRIRRRR